MHQQLSPCATISLDALLHNVDVVRSFLPDNVDVIAVVKDSSYGCGAAVIARTLLEEAGVQFFAVASAHEALFLRKQGIKGDILIFGKISAEELQGVSQEHCLCTLSDIEDIAAWKDSVVPLRFHVEIDTGMHRMGIPPDAVPTLISLLHETPHLSLDGLFTHMASADVPGTPTVATQLSLFRSVVAQFNKSGFYPRCLHASNSAAIMRFPSHPFTHARPGIALYGCQPDPAQSFSSSLQPLITLSGRIVSLRTVPAATPISYGGHYTTTGQTTIATIGIGYAHGVPRYLSNCGSVLINGKRYTIAGNVTMDYCMIDAGPHPQMHVGDEAYIIGSQDTATITPDDVAKLGNTIGYEVLCNIGPAIEHRYLRNGLAVFTSAPYTY